MEASFTVLVGVLLFARIGLKRDVPMAAFYLACGAWAAQLAWAPVSSSLDWILSSFGIIERYNAPPSILTLVNLAVSTVGGFALLAAVLVAARGAAVEPAPEKP